MPKVERVTQYDEAKGATDLSAYFDSLKAMIQSWSATTNWQD
jgi:hypothetical protein